MLRNRIYYLLKPFMPWRLCVALRRQLANYRRASHAEVWPIDPKSGAKPEGWPGWPEGKRFAFVLTHDVEGSKGLARVEQLMEVEEKFGFRSSFNFVPRGEYRLPSDLREKMERRGFEVGVHGLEHDGKLYSSKERFAKKAARIREYAGDWKAAGFRSPLMQHKLSWLHELGMEYDASTFDTDPFEPEPDGFGTIFPFWVPGPDNSGFVELPYTLVQDFTLFVVLRERNIDIWKRKLDWIAAHGGMALLNTHPDYMSFNGDAPARDEFPISHYEEFLRYAREKYDNALWTATPREVCRFYRASLAPAARNTRKRVCMVAYTTYECDNRVRRYAEALARRGDHVDVIAIASGYTSLGQEEMKGVTVHRIQRRELDERSKWTYAWRLLRFVWVSSWFLWRRHRQKPYDLIHIHNVPDFLVFSAWYPKWTGAKLILDIHDIVPELFASKFESGAGGRYVRFLRRVEKVSAEFVDHVIVSNHLWRDKLISRSVPENKCSVVLNHVDPTIFYQHARTRNDEKVILLFPGSFQWHQGLDIAIKAFAQIKAKVPNAEFHLYGGGGMQRELVRLADELGLQESVRFLGGVALDGMPAIIANADVGVVPKRADSFGDQAYSTKIMEFMSQGVPVVVSKTSIDTFYFDDRVVRFFTSGDVQAMAEAVLEVIQNKRLHDNLVAGGYEYVNQHGWESKKREYLGLVDSLTAEVFQESRLATPASGKSAIAEAPREPVLAGEAMPQEHEVRG